MRRQTIATGLPHLDGGVADTARTRRRRGRRPRQRIIFAAMLSLYAALTIAVLVGSPLDTLDRWARTLHVERQSPGWRRFVLDYVILGQRGPSSAVAVLWLAWLCHARRTLNPLVRFATALLLLNLSVGVVKLATGRWGPRVTAHAHDVLAGGDIFPSGHVSNAVVLFGVLAGLATRHRKAMTMLAVWISLSVGLGTVYLDTHWVTDVLGGWLAGGLVLMVLPRCVQTIEGRLETANRVFGRPLGGYRCLHDRAEGRTIQQQSRPPAAQPPSAAFEIGGGNPAPEESKRGGFDDRQGERTRAITP